MSLFREVEITDAFRGITANKGEILVNDGDKNTALSIDQDGYILTLDSTEPLGVKWAPSSNQQQNIDYTQLLLTTPNIPFLTNSTTPILITGTQTTTDTGTFLIVCNFTISISRNNRNATIGLYKNGVLVANSTRTISTSPAVRTVFTTQIIVSFTSGDTFETRLNINNIDTTATIYEGSIEIIDFGVNVSQINITGTNALTNSTTPVEIVDLTNTPTVGVYMILLNVIYGLSRNNRTLTLGLFKDNIIINGSSRTLAPSPGQRESAQLQFITDFDGLNELSIQFNVNNIDTVATIYERNLALIQLQ